jgi:hypothetical protein
MLHDFLMMFDTFITCYYPQQSLLQSMNATLKII